MKTFRTVLFVSILAMVATLVSCDVSGVTPHHPSANTDNPSTTDTNGNSGEGFRVTYHGNNHNVGSVPIDSNTYNQGESAVILFRNDLGLDFTDESGTSSTRTFVGWNTQADGNGTTYHPYRSLPIEGNLNLYARWAEPDAPTYRLFFWFAGQSSPYHDGNFYLLGDEVSLPGPLYFSNNVPIPEGRDLTGWISQSDINHVPNELFTIPINSNSRTFVAQFTNRIYTITFVGIDENVVGLSEGDIREVEFNTQMTQNSLDHNNFLQFTDALPSPTRPGFKLVDWERGWDWGYGPEWDSAWSTNGRMPAQNLELRPVWWPE